MLEGGGRFVAEFEAKKILSDAGIPVTGGALASSEGQAVEIAKKIGLPVVLKLVSPDLVHKSEAGAVKLNLATAEAVRAAYRDLASVARGMKVEGVYVQNFVPGGVEVIVGAKHDETFGPLVVFGLGGVFVEVMKDVAMRVVPFSEADARAMIEETRAHVILEGYRGTKADVDALVDLIMKLQRLLEGRRDIREVDMNPVKVLEEGKGVVVLDARMTMT